MTSRKPRTLLWRLGLGLMALQALIVFTLAWYGVSQFQDFSRAHTFEQLDRFAPLLAERYARVLSVNGELATDQVIRSVQADARGASLRITIVLPDGHILADSHADPSALGMQPDWPEVRAALAGQPSHQVRRSTVSGEQMAYRAELIGSVEEPVAVIRVALPLRSSSVQQGQFARAAAVAIAIVLGLTLLALSFMSRRITQNISRLTEGVGRFSGGQLHDRIEKPESGTFAVLADALNHMAQQLSDQIDVLRTQRAEQQTIYRSMSNGMIALDLTQRIISVNRAAEQLLQLSGSAARGRLLQELLREPQLNRFVTQAIMSNQNQTAEFELLSRPGIKVQASSESLRDVRDQPIGILVFINDVTQLRRLESIRSDFAANVSHELRTPITNIKGYVETMMDVGLNDQQQSRRFLEVIHRNTNRLASIIEDLLALARLEQPGTTAALEPAEVELARLADAATAGLDKERNTKRIKIINGIARDLRVWANAHLLEQALGNLLSNAVRYSPPRTSVHIGAHHLENGETVVSVRDEGPGIPAEHLDRIFERFYRVDRARSREMGGTGLGLSIVKHIALVHGGRVEVSSEVGRGSEFRIILPARV